MNDFHFGAYGNKRPYFLAQAPYAVPRTTLLFVSDVLGTSKIAVDLVSRDGTYWCMGDNLYKWGIAEGNAKASFNLLTGVPILVGPNWVFTKDTVYSPTCDKVLQDTPIVYRLSDLLKGNFEEIDFSSIVEFPCLRGLSFGNCFFTSEWLYTSRKFNFKYVPVKYLELLDFYNSLTNTTAKNAILVRLSQVDQPYNIILNNPQELYSVTFYKKSSDDLYYVDPANKGGLWYQDDKLVVYSPSECGLGYLVMSSFDYTNNTSYCFGFSAVNTGVFTPATTDDDGFFIPTVDGIMYSVQDTSKDKQGELTPIKIITEGWSWSDSSKSLSKTLGSDCYLSTLWGSLFTPSIVHMNSDDELFQLYQLDLTIPRWNIYGGKSSTLFPWINPSGSKIHDVVDTGVISLAAGSSLLTDIRNMRRVSIPGYPNNITSSNENTNAKIASYGNRGDVDNYSLVTCTSQSPLSSPASKNHSMYIPDDVVLLPWYCKIGDILPIGWWDWDSIDLHGGQPNPAGWGDEDASNDISQTSIRILRRSMFFTSDGYIYICYDNSGTVGIASFYFDGDSWQMHKNEYTVPDSRVAPWGQGCYYTYHYPGEDWTLFHAPVCYFKYQRLVQAVDWSWLVALSGLGGGFALYNMFLCMQAYEQYLSDSWGDSILVYADPCNLIVRGDKEFSKSSRIVDNGQFWTFAGWAVIDTLPTAIFSVVTASQGWNPTPEVWGISKNECKKLNASTIGAVGDVALSLVPSTYYPRMGVAADSNSRLKEILDKYGDASDDYFYDIFTLAHVNSSSLAESINARWQEWLSKAADVNKSSIVLGQLTNHEMFTSVALDPLVDIVDMKILTDTNTSKSTILMRHETGIWLSLRCSVEYTKFLCEVDTEWELITLGSRSDGVVMAYFGSGRCDYSTFMDTDNVMALFGFPQPWTRMPLYKWYARVLPVVICSNSDELSKLKSVLKTLKEE